MEFRAAFENNKEVQAFGSNALLIYAMMLKFDEISASELAADCLTDGQDDKKVDFIRLDSDAGVVTIAQAYLSKDWNKGSAKANKAADLNTAISWLLSGDLNEIPKRLQPKARELRDGVQDGEYTQIELLFVHNLKSSENVQRELKTCADHARNLLRAKGHSIEIACEEVDAEKINEWYLAYERPILIKDKLEVDVADCFEENGQDWSAITTSVSTKFLRELRQKYSEDLLFSANPRKYLGRKKDKRNINNKIIETAEKEPQNFWIYNNGVTAITNKFEKQDGKLMIHGIAIINGAQTTGSLSEANPSLLGESRVVFRIIRTQRRDIIDNIVRFNNTQNVIYSWELRSGDRIQKNLKSQFEALNIIFTNKRSSERARGDAIGVSSAAQALMAFHGKPLVALKGKNEIFESNDHYRSIFGDYTTAEHICFVYAATIAYNNYKNALTEKNREKLLMEADQKKLDYMGFFNFKHFLVFCVGQAIEIILNQKINSKTTLHFVNSKVGLETLSQQWTPIIPNIINSILSAIRDPNELYRGMKSDPRMYEMVNQIIPILQAIRENTPNVFDNFAQVVEIS